MTSQRDLALARVADELSGQVLPFAWYVLGPTEDGIELEVAPADCAAAIAYFAARPVELADATPVRFSVKPRRGGSWVVPPAAGIDVPGPLDASGLLGRSVYDAAERASAMGWRVRAHEREAAVTADFDPRRLDLCFDDEQMVRSVGRG